MERAPSVLIIMADQMRWLDMGCAGGRAKTPELDRLGQEGILATHCYANTPVCGPSRASFFTGTHSMRHRIVINDLPLAADDVTIGEVARDAGYETAYVGKWHLDGVPRSKFTPPGPRRHGFEYWAVHNCTHQYFHPRYYRDEPTMIEVEGYEPHVQTDLMLEFLNGLDDRRPFLGVLSWGPPHDPYDQVPREFQDLYDINSLDPLPNVDVDDVRKNPLVRRLTVAQMTRDYYAAYSALDAEVGRLVRHLDELGRSRDTIVCFVSDHGDMLGAHGYLFKQQPYEESVRIPLILRWPDGLPEGSTDDQLIGVVDLAPTLLGLAGLPVPTEFQGSDLSRSLGRGDPGADALLLASVVSFSQSFMQGVPEWRGVRTARHTYVETVGRTPWLLFDNENDPWQMNNLVSEEADQATRAQLGDALSRLLQETGDPFEPQEVMVDQLGWREAWDSLQTKGYD